MSADISPAPELPAPDPRPRHRPWRRRLKRLGKTLAVAVLALYLTVWWVSLRIVEHPSWPPPADAVTSEQAQSVTEAFARRDNPRRDDVAIPYAPTTASTVQLFSDGTAFFPVMLDDIRAARSSINIMMFGLTPGTIADSFVAALEVRAAAGVPIRMVVDEYGAKVDAKSHSYFDRLRRAGVEVVVNNPFPADRDGPIGNRSIDWRFDEIGEVDHRKALVIDGQVGWVGGAGLQDHFNGGTFHDVFTRVEGNIVRQMQAVAMTSFVSYGGTLDGEPGALAAYFPAPADPGSIRTTLLQNIPGGFLQGTQASRAIIEHATQRLAIMNPYLTDPGILDRVVDAARRGAMVQIVLPGKSNNPPADAAVRHEYPRLFAAGAEIWEYPVVMHAKVTVADDAVIIGTINFDAWALYRNLEIGLLFEDAGVADRVMAQLVSPDIEASTAAVPDSGTVASVRNWVWDKLTYFL